MQVDLRVPVPVNASMKALPKRKGNGGGARLRRRSLSASMKALPKRKGNITKIEEISTNYGPQ